MPVNPKALVLGVQVERSSEGSVVRTAAGAVHHLPPVTLAVWQAADGRTDTQGLLAAARAVDAQATSRTVFNALDALADAGLLAERVAPPAAAGMDRRTVIRTMAAAAGAALVVLPGAGRAAEAKNAEQNVKVVRVSEEKTKKELVTAEAAAKEQEAKGTATPELKKKEEAAKAKLQALRAQAKEESQKLTRNQEEADKVSPDARKQEEADKAK
jgi:hypothetical protein